MEEKKKYFYDGKARDLDNFGSVKERQSIRDRKMIKDKMLSDEESKIYFYTTSKFMETNNNQVGDNFQTFNYRANNNDEQSILEKFSSAASTSFQCTTVSLVCTLLVLTTFINILV